MIENFLQFTNNLINIIRILNLYYYQYICFILSYNVY